MISTWVMAAALTAGADEVITKFVPSGITEKVGSYTPNRAEMDGKAESVKKAPEGLVAPKFGVLHLNDKDYLFILDEPQDQPARLFVDSNHDGDLTNDPVPKWIAQTTGLRVHNGTTKINLGEGKLATINLYRFDPAQEQRPAFKNTLYYYGDFGYELTLELDGKKFTTHTSADIRRGLWIDRDGNKKRSTMHEMVSFGKPFNFTGTTYVLSREGESFKLAKADKPLPLAPMPVDLGIGKKAIPFELEALDGTPISFPKQYAGKVVLLDFWATWCGPCVAELPHVKEAYKEWHEKGLEILGVTFDKEADKEKVDAFLKKQELPWKQVYGAKGAHPTLGQRYEVTSIPFVLLVDGDTGEILGTSEELRGPGLSAYVGKQLEKKKKITAR